MCNSEYQVSLWGEGAGDKARKCLALSRGRGGVTQTILCSDTAYTWSQTVLDTSDNLLTNPDFSNKVQYNFQLQICRNITKPMDPMACNVTSPAYMVCLLHVVLSIIKIYAMFFCASLLHVVCVCVCGGGGGGGEARNELFNFYLPLLSRNALSCSLYHFGFPNRWIRLQRHVMLLEALILPPLNQTHLWTVSVTPPLPLDRARHFLALCRVICAEAH